MIVLSSLSWICKAFLLMTGLTLTMLILFALSCEDFPEDWPEDWH